MVPFTRLNPPVLSKVVLLLWILFVSYVSYLPLLCFLALWSPAENGWSLGSLVCCVFLCFVTFPHVKWSTSEMRVRLVLLNLSKTSSNYFHTDHSKTVFFVDLFCYLCFTFVFISMSCLFLAPLWSPAGKGLTSWLSCVWCFPVFLSLSHMMYRVRWRKYLIVSIPDICLLLYLDTIITKVHQNNR